MTHLLGLSPSVLGAEGRGFESLRALAWGARGHPSGNGRPTEHWILIPLSVGRLSLRYAWPHSA